MKAKYSPQLSCSVELTGQEEDLGDYAQISVLNMILPVMVFIISAVLAIIVHICGRSWTPPSRQFSLLNSRNKMRTTTDLEPIINSRSVPNGLRLSITQSCNAGLNQPPQYVPTDSNTKIMSPQESWDENEEPVVNQEQIDSLFLTDIDNFLEHRVQDLVDAKLREREEYIEEV